MGCMTLTMVQRHARLATGNHEVNKAHPHLQAALRFSFISSALRSALSAVFFSAIPSAVFSAVFSTALPTALSMTVSLLHALQSQEVLRRIVRFVTLADVRMILVQHIWIMIGISFGVLFFGDVEGFILACNASDHKFSGFPDALSVLQAFDLGPFLSELTVQEVPVRV
jgi:hypothetical protein